MRNRSPLFLGLALFLVGSLAASPASPSDDERTLQKPPAGVQRLRVALNGQDEPTTNVDVFVKRGALAGPAAADCSGSGPGNYAFCEFDAPEAGPWFIHLRQGGGGAGDFQVAVTLLWPRGREDDAPC